jgi:hypothetical protein
MGQAALVEDFGDARVDVGRRVGTRGADVDAAFGALDEDGGGDLRASGVVDAHKEHLGNRLVEQSLALGERAELLASEPLREQRDEWALSLRARQPVECCLEALLDDVRAEERGVLAAEIGEVALQAAAGGRVEMLWQSAGRHVRTPG